MSSSDVAIDRRSSNLLLTILELKDAVITAATVNLLGPEAFQPLCAAGLLRPTGYSTAVATTADHDDRPVELRWDGAGQCYGYFSSDAGWAPVSSDDIRCWRVDAVTLFRHVFDTAVSARSEIVSNLIWNLGGLRFGNRESRTESWFVRRLYDKHVKACFQDLARRRPASETAVVLTSSPASRLSDEYIAGYRIIALEDVLDPQSLRLRDTVVALRLQGLSREEAKRPLYVSPDGRFVVLHGTRFEFPRGDKVRQVLIYMYAKYIEGVFSVSTAEIVAELDLGESTRVRDLFRKNPAWEVLLSERGGACRFHL